jgi:hypothetical protein
MSDSFWIPGLTLVCLTNGTVETYEVHLIDPMAEEAKLRSSRSQMDLKSFFTPLPSRPQSRAGSEQTKTRTDKEEPAKSSDFGKILGKRLLGRSSGKSVNEKMSQVFILGPPQQQKVEGLLPWTGIRLWGSLGIGWNSGLSQVNSAHVSCRGKVWSLTRLNLYNDAVLQSRLVWNGPSAIAYQACTSSKISDPIARH